VIKTTLGNHVATVEIDRPQKKNAITGEMYLALAQAVRDANADPAVRSVLITGQPGVFTAGNDLEDFMRNREGGELPSVAFMRSPAACDKPVIAAVTGLAVGIGTTMLLHCDFVVLAEDAQLSTPFVNLALVPEAASTLLMPLRIGYARAYEMFAFGETVDASTALRLGIANRVVPLDRLHAEAAAIAQRLAKLPAGSLAATKRLMRNPEVLTAQIAAESECFAERLTTAEAREAFTAFAERRPPDFAKLAG